MCFSKCSKFYNKLIAYVCALVFHVHIIFSFIYAIYYLRVKSKKKIGL